MRQKRRKHLGQILYSESEGKDFKDAFYAPENYGTWQTQTEEET